MANNPLKVGIDDGDLPPLGATTDADASGNGSLIGVMKRIRTLFGGGLPSALVANRLPVDGSGVTQPIAAAGTVIASTTTPLAGGGTYASGTIDVSAYSSMVIRVVADVASGAGGILLRWSTSGGTTFEQEAWTYIPSTHFGLAGSFTLHVRPKGSHLRVIYTNGAAAQATFELQVVGRPAAFNGSPEALASGFIGAVYLRTPDVFKTLSATANGSTALWTPSNAVLRFRLLRFKVMVTANAYLAARGVLTIKLLDNATDLNLTHDVYLGQTAVAADVNPQGVAPLDTGWIDLGGFGILSAAANQTLNVNLSAAVSGGNVRVIAAGVEE